MTQENNAPPATFLGVLREFAAMPTNKQMYLRLYNTENVSLARQKALVHGWQQSVQFTALSSSSAVGRHLWCWFCAFALDFHKNASVCGQCGEMWMYGTDLSPAESPPYEFAYIVSLRKLDQCLACVSRVLVCHFSFCPSLFNTTLPEIAR